MSAAHRPGHSRGFALLEAIVALVIVASVGAALFALINTGVQNLRRAQANVVLTTLQPEVLSWIRRVDLHELPSTREASITLMDNGHPMDVHARFKLNKGPALALTQSGQAGNYQIALYDVSVVFVKKGQVIGRFATRRAAYRKVRNAPGS